jgi:hypothetical protein
MTFTPPSGSGGGKTSGGGAFTVPSGVETSPTKKSSSQADVKVVRTAVRVLRGLNKQFGKVNKDGTPVISKPQRENILYETGQALSGLPEQKVYRIGEKAKLPVGEVDLIVYGTHYKEAVPTEAFVADVVGRPVQAIKGAIVEGRRPGPSGGGLYVSAGGYDPLAGLKGAWRGFSGTEKYSGSQTFAAGALGKTKKEARQWAKNLPAGARVPLDIITDIGLDPLTWITLGGGAIAENAARTVASRAAGAVDTAVLSKLSNTIYDDIARFGLKRGLAKHLNETELSDFLKQMPKSVQRQAGKLRPGVYVAGQRIPGSAGVRVSTGLSKLRSIGPKTTSEEIAPKGLAGSIEASTRTRAATRQAVRAGEVRPTAIQDVENAIVGIRAGRESAKLAERAVQKDLAYTLGEVLPRTFKSNLGKDAMERAFIYQGEKWIRDNPESLQRIYAALDVGGTPEAFNALSDVEKTLASRIKEWRDLSYAEKVKSGRLLPEEEARAAVKGAAANKGGVASKIEKQSARVAKQGERVAKADTRAAAAEEKLNQAIDADFARAQQAVDAQGVSRADAIELRSIRSAQLENARNAVRAVRERTRELIGAEQEVRAAKAAIEDAARPVKRLEKLVQKASKSVQNAAGDLSRQRAADRLATLEDQLFTAREQNNLLQSSLNEQLDQALTKRDALKEAFDVSKRDVEAFAIRERPGDVNLPRRPGRARPTISAQQAQRIRQVVKAAERARAAAKEQSKLVNQLNRLEARQARYVAEADVVPAEQYLRRLPSGEVIESIPRRAGSEANAGLSSRGPGFIRARKVPGPASEATINIPGKGDVPLFDLNPVRSVAKDAADVVRDQTRINLSDQLRNIRVTLPEGEFPAIIDDPAQIKALLDDPNSTVLNSYRKMKLPVREIGQDEQQLINFLDNADDATLNEMNLDDIVNPRLREQEVYVHEATAKDIETATKMLVPNGKAARAVLYMNALWARSGVATFGFVSRNVLQGNLFLAMMAGALKPGDLPEWARMLSLFKRAHRGMERFGDFTRYLLPEEATFFKGALDNGVITSSFQSYVDDLISGLRTTAGTSGGIRGAVGKTLRTGRYSPVSPEFIGFEKIGAANQWMENWSRLSVYKAKLRQGFSEPEAAAITNKFMLNYKDLAPTNRGLRYFSPFITWTYKMVPLVTGTLFRDPKKILIPQHIIKALNEEGMSSENIDVFPEWMRRANTLVLPKAIREKLPFGFDKTPQVLSLDIPASTAMRASLPIESLYNLLKGRTGADQQAAIDLINLLQLGGLAGTGKALFESASGKNLFTGRQYQKGERIPTPAGLVPIYGKTMPWATYNVLQSLSPLIQRLGVISPTDAKGQSAQARQLTSMLAGISLYPYTKQTRESELYRRSASLDALIASLRAQGIKIPKKSNIQKETTSGFIPPSG